MSGSELNQVWTNLLGTAIDALGEQETITITSGPDAGGVRVDIADDGRGTGLGLATARRIVVDRHDGTLTLDSGPDGTTFHVWLPLTQS